MSHFSTVLPAETLAAAHYVTYLTCAKAPVTRETASIDGVGDTPSISTPIPGGTHKRDYDHGAHHQ
jgi:hypothetical protein